MDPASCAVASSDAFSLEARQLAGQLQLPYIALSATEKPSLELTPAMAFSCLLIVDEQGVALRLTDDAAPGAVRCDFVAGALAHRRKYGGGKKQDLCRAIGLDKRADLSVLDMTAGLGRDAFVLASLGARVSLVERNPAVWALLADGLQRARQHGEQNDAGLLAIIQRMQLRSGDSTILLAEDNTQPDVVYLDPMFPTRQKSAKVKKEMQAFHILVGEYDDTGQLLSVALEQARYRAVVKRPTAAPHLAGKEPNYSIAGKSIRYDIYTKKALGS